MSLDAREGESGDLAAAIGHYALGDVSLGRAAEMAGLTRWEMADVLEDVGVPVRLGPDSDEALADEVETARDLE